MNAFTFVVPAFIRLTTLLFLSAAYWPAQGLAAEQVPLSIQESKDTDSLQLHVPLQIAPDGKSFTVPRNLRKVLEQTLAENKEFSNGGQTNVDEVMNALQTAVKNVVANSNPNDPLLTDGKTVIVSIKRQPNMEQILHTAPKTTTSSTNFEQKQLTPEQLNDLSNILPESMMKGITEGFDKTANSVSIEVPAYFRKTGMLPEQIMQEINYYVSHNRRWRERVVLEIIYNNIKGIAITKGSGQQKAYITDFLTNWLDDSVEHCAWRGITCGTIPQTQQKNKNGSKIKDCWCIANQELQEWDWGIENDHKADAKRNSCQCSEGFTSKSKPPTNAITKIDFSALKFSLELPPELYHLKFLQHLNMNGQTISDGGIPKEFGYFENLHQLELSRLVGTDLKLPKELSQLNQTLQVLKMNNAGLEGSIPEIIFDFNLRHLDLGYNKLTGSIPSKIQTMSSLEFLDLGSNSLTGPVPNELGSLSFLELLFLDNNNLSGTIPTSLGNCSQLQSLLLWHNSLKGTFPSHIFNLSSLKDLNLSENRLYGTLPTVADTGKDWSSTHLTNIKLNKNRFDGTIPRGIFTPTLRHLDLTQNKLLGSIPKTLGNAKLLNAFLIQSNMIGGTIPTEILELKNLKLLSVAKNRLIGHVDRRLCEGRMPGNFPFPCINAIACPAGTYHPAGAASPTVNCMTCYSCQRMNANSPPNCKYIGQSECIDSYNFTDSDLRGDMDGDGELDQREVLRLIYLQTGGITWGENYYQWGDLDYDACSLSGVNCKNGMVTKLDLRGAKMCDTGSLCKIPSDIGLLGETLEVLDLSSSLTGSLPIQIPTEIGMLKKLKILDVSQNSLSGTLPSEIGKCTDLRVLNLSQTKLKGPLPSTIENLKKLEKMDARECSLNGSIPTELGQMSNIRELLLSESKLTGSIPSEITNLVQLRNLELYSNGLTGSLPLGLSNLTNLRRFDVYLNKLSGPIDDLMKIHSLETVHLAQNQFSGTLPSHMSALKFLLWFDISENSFVGQIPEAIGSLTYLKHFQVGKNKLSPPIPSSLCTGPKKPGQNEPSCDSFACPIGTFASKGFAGTGSSCESCPPGEGNFYIGSDKCTKLTQRDFLSMFFKTMNGYSWAVELNKGWDNDDVTECDWAGIECDEDGNVMSLAFPTSALNFDEEFLIGRR